MPDKLITLEKQIQKLKEKRNKLYAQQAVLFFKAVENIFKDGFCPNLILGILTQTYATSSAIRQQEWEQRAPSSRTESPDSNCKKPQTTETTHYES